MSIIRRSRLLFWAARELSKKYTKSLVVGIVLGFGLMVSFWTIFPLINATTLNKIQRIGYIGEYTPSTLPISIQQHISSGLTTIDSNGTIQPGLATFWEATDSGKTYIFHLDKNAVWHTGKTVTSKDINYNIRNVTLESPNLNTLIVRLQSPFSPFLTFVSKPIFTSNLTGFGPYKIHAIRLKGDKIVFLRLVETKNQNLPTLEYRFYRSETQALIAYKLGEVDSISGLTQLDSEITTWKNTKVQHVVNDNRLVALYFNTKNTLMKEKLVRQALVYAIPDFGQKRAYSPISPSSWAYTSEVKHYDTDVKLAKKLIDDSKISSSSSELTLHTFSQYLPIAQQIAQSWQTIGIKTDIRVTSTVPEEYQILLSAQEISTDPDQYIYWHSTQLGTNITGFSNAKIDKLLEDGRVELDQEKRKKLYIDFQKRLVEELPAAFLYYPPEYTITRSK